MSMKAKYCGEERVGFHIGFRLVELMAVVKSERGKGGRSLKFLGEALRDWGEIVFVFLMLSVMFCLCFCRLS